MPIIAHRNCCIYRILCTVNGKVYIGQTVNPDGRRDTHFTQLKKGAHKNKRLQGDYDKLGIIAILDVTVAGGALKTLRMDLETIDPVSGNAVALGSTNIIGSTVTPIGTYALLIYPGGSNPLPSLLTSLFAAPISIPRRWRIKIIPSDSSNWTYSLGICSLR